MKQNFKTDCINYFFFQFEKLETVIKIEKFRKGGIHFKISPFQENFKLLR